MQGCLSQFRVNVEGTFWTYGDTIYSPGGVNIPPDVVAHEEQHSRQQEAYQGCVHKSSEEPCTEECQKKWGKDAWWRRYLIDPRFRLEQEAEAYGTQYRFFCENVGDRNKRAIFLHRLAAILAGPLYQVAVSTQQAKALILVLSGERKLSDVAQTT